MSTSKHTARPQQSDVPFAVQRRRTVMACVNCRRRKMRCITPEQPPRNPCARCTKKGLLCEYVPADQDDDSHSLDAALVESSWEAPPIPALPLPYTRPPPPNMRPRYSGSNYPDLSLSGSPSSSQKLPPQYYPHSQTNTPMLNQGHNPQAAHNYQYMTNYGTPGAQPGSYPAGSSGYPTNYEQMQYDNINKTKPAYGWPPQ